MLRDGGIIVDISLPFLLQGTGVYIGQNTAGIVQRYDAAGLT